MGRCWRLLYDGCGHEPRFDRVMQRLFEPADVEREVHLLHGLPDVRLVDSGGADESTHYLSS